MAPPLAVVKFGSKSRCPVTLTYIRRSKSLYRWALPGSDFYFQIWPPQGVEPLFQYLFCFSLYRWVLPGSDFEIDVDRFHIIFFLLKTTLFGSKSSKFESKSCCLLMLTYRRYCLSLYWWGLLGSDFEIDVDRFHIFSFFFLLNTHLERSESSKFELSFILEGLDKIRSQIWSRQQILINVRYLDNSKKKFGIFRNVLEYSKKIKTFLVPH